MSKNWKNAVGYFRSVKKPEEQCPGELKISHRHILLNLFGILHYEVNDPLGINRSAGPEIIGDTNKGRVLLSYSRGSSVSFGLINGTKSSTEYFGLAIVSENGFASIEKVGFDSISFRINGLADFVGKSNLNATLVRNEEGKVVSMSQIADLNTDLLGVYETNEYYIKFIPTYKQSISLTAVNDKRSAPIEEVIYIEVSRKTGDISVDETIELINSFRNFIAYSLRLAVNIISVRGFNTYGNKSDTKDILETRLYWEGMRKLRYKSSRDRFSRLCTLQDFAEDFGVKFQKWLEVQKKHKTLYDNLISNLYARQQFIENKILSYFTAIESYVTETMSGNIVKERNERNVRSIEEVKSAIQVMPDSEIKSYILEQLGYFKEDVSAAEKLQLLYDMLPNSLKQRITFEDLDLAKRLRNKIVHGDKYDTLLIDGQSKGIINTMRVLGEFCLLKELVVSESKVEEILGRIIDYQKNWT